MINLWNPEWWWRQFLGAWAQLGAVYLLECDGRLQVCYLTGRAPARRR